MKNRCILPLIAGLFTLITGINMAQSEDFSKMSDKDWQQKLTPEQYNVMRKEATEAPFTSPLNDEKSDGVFVCAACGQELFVSQNKFDSGTGWPSFYDALKDSVATKTDYKSIYPRTEFHCSRCGSHLGHIFEDGPEPTGLRYCTNGVALKFVNRDGEL